MANINDRLQETSYPGENHTEMYVCAWGNDGEISKVGALGEAYKNHMASNPDVP
jgi:hypothetical protein